MTGVKISSRIRAVRESPTCRLDGMVKELAAKGSRIINLCAGEPDFRTPDLVANAGRAAISAGKTKYTPVAGTLESRQAIRQDFARRGLDFKVEQIVVSNGAKQILYSLFQVLLEPGDEVVVVAPYWVSYVEQIKLAGGVPVVVESRDDFSLDVDRISEAVRERTAAVVINSPNNPTGVVYDQESLKNLGELAKEKDFWVISDEVYRKLIYRGECFSVADLGPEVRRRVLLVDGVSKSLAMTGWRIGYLAGDAAVAAGMIKLQSQLSSGPSSISQEAVRVALEDGAEEETAEMVRIMSRRRELVGRGLERIGVRGLTWPGGAFYFFVPIKSTGLSSEDFCARLLAEEKIALVPGTAFGREGYVRLSYAASEKDLEEALAGMKRFLKTI